jgi:hypothetical protein
VFGDRAIGDPEPMHLPGREAASVGWKHVRHRSVG